MDLSDAGIRQAYGADMDPQTIHRIRSEHLEARSMATHQCQGPSAVMGLPLVGAGVHRWRYEIHRSFGNDGYGMMLGVADADATAAHHGRGRPSPRR